MFHFNIKLLFQFFYLKVVLNVYTSINLPCWQKVIPSKCHLNRRKNKPNFNNNKIQTIVIKIVSNPRMSVIIRIIE